MRLLAGWLNFAIRCALGGLFLYAGIVKLRSPGAFASDIAAFQLLPPQGSELLAASLPPFEILLGTLLLTGRQRRAAAFCAMLLAAVFAVALSSALARGLVLDCGCFGDGAPSAVHAWLALARDLVLLAAAGWLYFRERSTQANA